MSSQGATMGEAARKILHLMLEGGLPSSDGMRLLNALAVGYPEEVEGRSPEELASLAGVPVQHSDLPAMGPREGLLTAVGEEEVVLDLEPVPAIETGQADTGLSGELQGMEQVQSPESSDSPGLVPKAAMLLSTIKTGDLIDVPSGVNLRIEQQLDESNSIDATGSIVLRGVDSHYLRLGTGSPASMRLENSEYTLMWRGPEILVEIPNNLHRLILANTKAQISVLGYSGPLEVRSADGGLKIQGATGPLEIRDVSGPVKLLGLALRQGASIIEAADSDIEIQIASDASVTARVSTSEGEVSLGENESPGHGLRRRGSWRFGSGRAELLVSTIRGHIRIYQTKSPAEGRDAPLA
jgi:hypothetical protein